MCLRGRRAEEDTEGVLKICGRGKVADCICLFA
ncbi:hypothetical protein IMSAGC002_02447 [Lachnospiraceae bacterium]|nr:hypothetical protein IMSAGC002_02447 [Lachnospiraceae bacterium]